MSEEFPRIPEVILPVAPTQSVTLHMQKLGLAFRPGNKPRLFWSSSDNKWVYDSKSFLTIIKLTDKEVEFYRNFRCKLNKLNKV